MAVPAMSQLNLLLVAAVAAAAPFAAAAGGAASPNGAVNDALPGFGFPRGLLPDTVASYTFDNGTGDFEVNLAGPCYVRFGINVVHYEKAIRGRLSFGAISGLSGVQILHFFIWFNVSGLVAHPDGGTIEYFAAFTSEKLPASLFDEIPVCRARPAAAPVIRELGLLPDADA